jgi:hypothetical protein
LWWFPVALVGLTLASGCRSTDEVAASAAWGDEAVTYLQGLSDAYAADNSYRVLDFYAPGAELEMWRAGLRGGRVADLLLIGPRLNRELLEVYLGVDVTLAFIRWPESGKSSVVQSEFDNGSIVRDTVFDDVVSLAASQRATPEVIGRYNGLYGEFAEAWSSGRTDWVAALYAPEARMREALSGAQTAGREAIASLALDPPERWTRLPIDAIDDDDEDLAAGFALYLGPTEYGHDPQLAVGAYRVQRSGCSFQMAVRWVLADGVIVDERRYPEIESFRRCAVGLLPGGWWSDLTLPGPRDEVVTGTIRTAAQGIVVHNGTERLVGFVRWALERFDAVGLAEPRIESVTFEPSRRCEDLAGRVVLDGGSRHVFLCLHERDLCPGGQTCDRPVLNARIGILHELGHAWLLDHADEPVRTRLLDLTGLAAWDDGTAPWPQRGAEYAAEVLAWGLLDERAPMVRIGAPPCAELQVVFELLTGSAPLINRTECRP